MPATFRRVSDCDEGIKMFVSLRNSTEKRWFQFYRCLRKNLKRNILNVTRWAEVIVNVPSCLKSLILSLLSLLNTWTYSRSLYLFLGDTSWFDRMSSCLFALLVLCFLVYSSQASPVYKKVSCSIIKLYKMFLKWQPFGANISIISANDKKLVWLIYL